ncbi:8-oxoguanine DNA glycosylase OGG fold protein [Aeromicrobium massiliense]|uniref:8-oxoguanine DNA glycosylase OGG fold protein n=1 Tax=Aeromicrobium massiliense TaxID=1464554 RepID=UPI000308B45E|nr:hypothetical protein [Aeromicrobium massiliense]
MHLPYDLPATAREQVALVREKATQAGGPAPLEFDGPRPDVVRHTIRLGAGWRVSGSPLTAAGWDGRPVITRGAVLDWAAQARAGRRPWRQVLVASYAWGTGTVSYGPVRMARVLAAGGDVVEHAVTSAVRTLDEHGAVAAYWVLNNRAPAGLRLPFLGPAFFTKLLYFAGHELARAPIPPGTHRPLILDRVLASKPQIRPVVGGWTAGWRTSHYAAYLERMAALTPDGWAPDELELRLFSS